MTEKKEALQIERPFPELPRDQEAIMILQVAASTSVERGQSREEFLQLAAIAYDDRAALNAKAKA
jgi:hypothetical protein